MKAFSLVFAFCVYALQVGAQIKYAPSSNVPAQLGCARTCSYGKTPLCLPAIDGMVECYEDHNVKLVADKFKLSTNTALAFYLNDETYSKADRPIPANFDNYLILCHITSLVDRAIDPSHFTLINSAFSQYLTPVKWEYTKANIESQVTSLSVDKPVEIDHYSLTKEDYTYVLLTKYKAENFERVAIQIINLLRIKDRMVFLTYYKYYTGEESVNLARAKNDYIVLRFLEANK